MDYNEEKIKEGPEMLIYLQMIETPEEKSKFVVMYETHRGWMYRKAYDILRNTHDAEDIVHHTFVKVAENIKKIDDPKCPKTKGFIVTILMNGAIDIYRKKQSHPHVEFTDETVGAYMVYKGDDPVAECVLKLPDRMRTVILLKFWYECTMKEIAGILDISYANALKIEQRARGKLKVLCEEAGVAC